MDSITDKNGFVNFDNTCPSCGKQMTNFIHTNECKCSFEQIRIAFEQRLNVMEINNIKTIDIKLSLKELSEIFIRGYFLEHPKMTVKEKDIFVDGFSNGLKCSLESLKEKVKSKPLDFDGFKNRLE